jgi:hypothetical protein
MARIVQEITPMDNPTSITKKPWLWIQQPYFCVHLGYSIKYEH